MEVYNMKLALNRYGVYLKGTKKTPFYYGFKTQKEAREARDRLDRVTGQAHEIIDQKLNRIID